MRLMRSALPADGGCCSLSGHSAFHEDIARMKCSISTTSSRSSAAGRREEIQRAEKGHTLWTYLTIPTISIPSAHRVEGPNPEYARLLLDDYAGMVSEMMPSISTSSTTLICLKSWPMLPSCWKK